MNLPNKDFIFELEKEDKISSSTSVFRYTFSSVENRQQIPKFYSGLSTAGKGYNLVMLSTTKNRYYTICKTLGNKLID